MTIKRVLLTTVSSLAMLGAASAADLGIRKAPPPMVAPAPLWTGPYIGISGGVVRHDWSFTDVSCTRPSGGECDALFGSPTIWTDSKTGGIFGVHVGYNWQSSSLVYGVEADWNWLDSKQSIGPMGAEHITSATLSTKINWLATFRGRAGLAVDRTLLYLTGGAAVARVEDGWIGDKGDGLNTAVFEHHRTQWGWVAGVGLEHMWTPNWVLRAEVLHVDLGRETETFSNIPGGSDRVREFAYTHKLLIGRVGLSFKW